MSEELFDNAVIPYYLHSLDRVNGNQRYALSRGQVEQFMLNGSTCWRVT